MSYEAWGDGDDNPFENAIEAGWLDPADLSKALIDVMNERQRQQDGEGFIVDHDDRTNKNGELAMAATAYAINAAIQARMLARSKSAEEVQVMSRAAGVPEFWPWRSTWWKSKGARENLVRAAALLIAEIERLDRAQQSTAAAKE